MDRQVRPKKNQSAFVCVYTLTVMLLFIFIIAQPVFPEHGKYIMEMGGGEVGSFVGWAVGYNAGSLLGCGEDDCRTIALSSGLLLSTICTYLVGKRFDEGNVILTLLGGLATGVLVNQALKNNKDRYYAVSISFPVGEVIGFNLFKRNIREGSDN
ncbi:hypothetical protein CH333_10310 [candidate division WOR-3 bacterium JGI_Cruoil_03_44_89]|uniref:Uncharacterized protein n=1 Tax=candidate division WOR-3 bacterium JGI_Cruoil_03_44_89 TaxID=1973748 RepID=A0A235BMM6_UNCW3|nr:MAG: hypothetical protein CH333_10310 [candidate division WOR-3 bacterium JGI_Cruoil_03_44_89]